MLARESELNWSETATFAFDVVDAEFVVVTADGSDIDAYEPLSNLLKRMRRAFGVEFAFISEWSGGDPVVRRTAHGDAPEADPLQCEFGRRLLEDSGPATGWAFHAVPVATADGVVYGTLCCLMPHRQGEGSVRALGSVAQLIAAWFSDASLSLSGLMPLRGHSMMGGLPMTVY